MSHSPIGASSIERILKCPQSLKRHISTGAEKETTSYATEGNKLHKQAEEAIKKGKTKKIPSIIEPYVRDVIWWIQRCDYFFIEKTLKHPKYNIIFSTPDFYAYRRDRKWLIVIDYKSGKGIEVVPENNLQLKMYAYLASLNIEEPIDTIYAGICQPAFNDNTEYVKWTLKDLENFEKRIIKLLTKIKNNETLEIRAGKHCQFCPVKKDCEEYAKKQNKKTLELLNILED